MTIGPVFIVGTGRCGSTLMSRLLVSHPQILSLSEVFMQMASQAFVHRRPDGARFWRMLSEPTPGARKALSPQYSPDEFLYPFAPGTRFTPETLPPISYVTLPHLTDDPDGLYAALGEVIPQRPRAPLGVHYRFLFDWLTEYFGKTCWVERSGASLVMVPALRRLFPDAKFIHLTRDGRDVALSISRHPSTRFFARVWHVAGHVGLNPLRSPFRVGDSALMAAVEPYVDRVLPLDRWMDRPLPLPIIGAFWSDFVLTGLRYLDGLSAEQCLEMRYEDLLAYPQQELERFLRFVGPELMDRAWLDAASVVPRSTHSRWLELPDQDRAALERACAPGLAALGYST